MTKVGIVCSRHDNKIKQLELQNENKKEAHLSQRYRASAVITQFKIIQGHSDS